MIKAQDTVRLKEVDVTTGKTQLSAIGKKTETIDSVTKQRFVFNSVGDLLSLNTPVFIKNYGPGSLSSSSFRGGNASQTGIIWNGFNIQSMMLGQIDLALLPSALFDDIRSEFGGSSALWGSGAVGGSIHLDNQPRFNRGLTTKVNLGAGSFGLANASTNVEYSQSKFVSSTKAYLQSSINNFRYKDTLDKENPYKKQRHASYTFNGLMQEFRFILSPKQMLTVNGWYNTGNRELPVYNTLNISRAIQKDANLKTSLNWNYLSNKLNATIRAAYFHDQINYTDSALAVYSKSKLQTVIAESENIINWLKNNQLNLGINFTSATGVSNNYTGTKTLGKISFCAGNKFSFADQKIIIYTAVRTEYISSGQIPLTGNLSMEYKPIKNMSAKLNAAKVYRQPTLNERYWTPGGNPDLLPETGYTYEGDLTFTKRAGNFQASVSGSAFYRVIDNWILWLPGPNSTTPVNIQQVWSRGTETNTKLSFRRNKFAVGAGVITGYVLSTVTNSDQENGNTKDKQLIYTPRYTVNSHVSLAYDQLSLVYYHQYIGYRFTSSDNLQWLPPYHYSSVKLNWGTKLKETSVVLFASCNNLLDANYSVIAGRPMPLRNFELGISLSANKSLTKQNQVNTPEN
jgi:iron complex outermembrane receptor protein